MNLHQRCISSLYEVNNISGSTISSYRNSDSIIAGIMISCHRTGAGKWSGILRCGVSTYNLGTGRGYSVLELVKAFERVNGVHVPYVVDGRRAGDLGSVWSDPSKAWRELGWKAEKGIDEMCRDAWEWEKSRL